MNVTFEKPHRITKTQKEIIKRKVSFYNDSDRLLDELNYQFCFDRTGILFGKGGSHIWGKRIKSDGTLEQERSIIIC